MPGPDMETGPVSGPVLLEEESAIDAGSAEIARLGYQVPATGADRTAAPQPRRPPPDDRLRPRSSLPGADRGRFHVRAGKLSRQGFRRPPAG